MASGPVAAEIERKLKERLAAEDVEVVDESALHAGHREARPGGETHFRVAVTAAAFAGKPRLERQRLVHEILAEELAGPVHALSVTARAPGEGSAGGGGSGGAGGAQEPV